jgi:5-methylcytosine-specific restriction endonuclease McrA
MARDVAEWIGRTDNSMPTIKVLLRLYERQNGLCACGCGTWMDLNVDQIDCDHTVPLKDGGENRESNLQALLRRHHITKTNAENTARAAAERHKAKAFRHERAPAFSTNRNGKFKKRMDGVLVLRATGEPV